MAERVRITYATMSADNPKLHADYDEGMRTAKSWLGQKHQFYVNGEAREGEGYDEERSPIDRDIVIGYFARATKQDAKDAIEAARKFFPKWSGTPWDERVRIMRQAADAISDRAYELAALMAMEVGKSRLEAIGDVEETADLIRYYCKQLEDHDGFSFQMGALSEKEHNRSVLKPHGVWGVISPFNFPMALSGGPSGGALVAGNTVVYKPSSDAPLTGVHLAQIFHDAGLPAGVFNMVMGPGESVGAEIQENDGVDGIIFTGSFEVGWHLYKNFASRFPKPV